MSLFRKILPFLFIFISSPLLSQVTVSSGTNINIYTGTTITINNDTLRVNNSAIKNHGIISLKDSGYIIEALNFPIFGAGHEEIRITPKEIFNNKNIGGFGIIIYSNQIGNTILLKRGHEDIYAPQASIKRWYEFSPSIFTNNLTFSYDPSELNGVSSSQAMYNYDSNQSNWFKIDGTATTNEYNVPTPNQIEKLIVTDEQLNSITIFPNLGNNDLIIGNLPLNSISEISIYSIDGKLILSRKITTYNNTLSRINCNELASGVYLINIKLTNGNYYHKKWIKQ